MMSVDEQESESDFYTAAAHLINCPCPDTENILITFLKDRISSSQSIKIAKRKVVEVLARLGCTNAIPEIGKCLWSDDVYLVENTVWSLQTLRCQDQSLVDKMIDLLKEDIANQRIIMQCLSALDISRSVNIIRSFQNNTVPGIRGAAISANARLTRDFKRIPEISHNLFLPNQMDRQFAVQDLIDAGAVDQIARLFSAPVSPVFKMRAVRQLYEGHRIDFNLLLSIDSLLSCDLSVIDCVHQYDEIPSIDYLIRDLYNTDFSRCYLALKHLSLCPGPAIFPVLKKSWTDDAHNDYGAHYLFVCLFGLVSDWSLESLPWIFDILLSSISNMRPQFQKSRAASVLSLAKLMPSILLDSFPEILSTRGLFSWDIRYALIQAMDKYIDLDLSVKQRFIFNILDGDNDPFLQARSRMASAS